MKRLIYVEGIIGSGKSTVLQNCAKKYPGILVMPECVSDWQNLHTQRGETINLLELYYKDTKKWGFTFQIQVLKTLAERHHSITTSEAVVMAERSLQSSVKLFSHLAWESQLLSSLEYTIINNWYDYLRQSTPIEPTHVLYLATSAEIAMERINQRGRPEEKTLSVEYLERLRLRQECLLHNEEYGGKIIQINGNQSEENVMAEIAGLEAELFA